MTAISEVSEIVSAADRAGSQVEQQQLQEAMRSVRDTEESVDSLLSAINFQITNTGGLSMESMAFAHLVLKAGDYHSNVSLESFVPSLESISGTGRTIFPVDQLERYRNVLRGNKRILAERLSEMSQR